MRKRTTGLLWLGCLCLALVGCQRIHYEKELVVISNQHSKHNSQESILLGNRSRQTLVAIYYTDFKRIVALEAENLYSKVVPIEIAYTNSDCFIAWIVW